MNHNGKNGWIIKVTAKLTHINQVNTWFVVSKNRVGKGFKGGSDISMAKIYKNKNMADEIANIIKNEHIKVELIPV